MGATYTRQSTYADGDTITAAHTNDEFDQLLAAFAASTGHTHDGTTGEGGPISTMAGHALTFGAGTSGTDIVMTFDGETNDGVLKWMEDEDYFEFSDDILIATSEKIQFRDTAIYINSSADGQLDLVADTEIQIAATTIDINGLVDISGNLSVGGNLDVTGTFDLSDSNFTNAGDIQLDSISGDSDTNTSIAFSGSDVITITTGGETQITFNNGSILPTTDNDVDLGSSSLEFKDIYIDGTAYLDAINFNGTAISATAAELNIMDGVTSTAAELNILDGVTATAAELNILDVSNTTIGDLSEISTVANDDVFLAVDTSGGGLKKITRSNIVSGLATSAALSNIVEDTSPQLGGNLDTNSNNILIDDAHFIGDENGNEQIVFQTTSSAVNQIEVTNAASGSGVQIASTGGDTNIDLKLLPKGSGQVVIDGNVGIESGLIDLKNAGAQSQIKFYCESSNAHAQILQGAPHSEAASNTLTLPSTGGNVNLVSTASTDTLTNKTLTAPKIADGGFLADANGNELVVFQTTSSAVNQLEITNNASGSNPILAATGGDTNIGIALTPKGTGEIVIGAGNLNYGGTAVTSTGAELNILDGVTSTAAELNILDGVTSTAAELNILDGATVVVGEINALDLGATAVGTAIASKAMVLDSNKDYTGVRNFTLSGVLKTDDTTEATSTTDGSLQTDGGLSVVKDAVFGDDVKLLSDASVISFGANSEVTLTHVHDVGLALKHTATADDKPIVLTLQTGETDMAANDVIGKLAFQAPDEGTGTDAILVAAAMQAVAEGDFSSSNNATRLEFHTGASEAAAVKMTLNSTGAVKPVTYQETYASLSAASTVDCDLLTANHFAVTLDQNTTFTFSNPPSSGTSFAFTLIVTQHSTAVTLTWPNTVDWAGGSAPDAAGNNEVQAYGFITRDGGTTYYGFLGGTAIG